MICGKCKQEKPESEFAKNNQRARGYQYYCRECSSSTRNDWYHRSESAKKKARADGIRRYRDRVKAQQQQRKELGLCYWCDQPALLGQTRCQFHSTKARKEQTVRSIKEWSKLRSIVFDHYGRKCACCGEGNQLFLSIDHMNGGGNKHRKLISNLYRWLVANDCPVGFQTLCMNCNWGSARNHGTCPHKQQPAQHPIDKILAQFGEVQTVQ